MHHEHDLGRFVRFGCGRCELDLCPLFDEDGKFRCLVPDYCIDERAWREIGLAQVRQARTSLAKVSVDTCFTFPHASTAFVSLQLQANPRGNELMNKISDKIKSGARSFLKTEYYYLAYFISVVFIVLIILYTLDPPSIASSRTDGIRYAACFLIGAMLSASSGWYGMMVATDANVRTTQAAKEKGLSVALRVAFTGGAVMGFTVVGLGLFGISITFFLMTLGNTDQPIEVRMVDAADTIAAFGFGASSIALFARVAGGICKWKQARVIE